MATNFFVCSNKEVGKKTPPLLVRRCAVLCAPRHWRERKKLAAIRLPLKQLFVLIRQSLRCSTH